MYNNTVKPLVCISCPFTQRKMPARARTRDDFARSHVPTCQDSEYIKTAEDAWQEAIDLVNTTDGWKEEKGDKNTVRKSAVCPSVCGTNLNIDRGLWWRVGRTPRGGRSTDARPR